MNNEQPRSERLAFAEIFEAVEPRLAKNQRVRRILPGDGRLKMDRQLPFLCIYRTPPSEDPGTRELVTSEAAYLFASGEDEYHSDLSQLCQLVATTMEENFGTFLFIEIWADASRFESDVLHAHDPPQPAFEIVTSDLESIPTTVEVFEKALSRIHIDGRKAEVRAPCRAEPVPPGLQPLVYENADRAATGRFSLGLVVRPVYRDSDSGIVFPMVLQSIRAQLARALRRAIGEFTGCQPQFETLHPHALGPTALVAAASQVDRQLCEVSESFDFLLQVTPVNSDRAWSEFADNRYSVAPAFHYRALPYHPSLLKRQLFNIEVERIEDTTLAHLFLEKQDELDRQISALHNLGTEHFLSSSQQLYGVPEASLLQLAEKIVSSTVADPSDASGQCLNVNEIAARAREEIEYYQRQMPEFNATVELRDDVAAGIMVSHDRLLLSDMLQLRRERVEPLLHHEIGTHLLTYFNGRCQPFHQLYAGLAGYEELQEGLAVMAEYLTNGLTESRLRTLAARVIAVQSMLEDLPFIETFERLAEECKLSPRTAFVTTLRAYRGGGLTKDILYLRGLRDVLAYLSRGHDIEPLYVGKIGLQHVPFIQELRRRGIVNAPGVLPRFWSDSAAQQQLERCRGLSVVQLLETLR